HGKGALRHLRVTPAETRSLLWAGGQARSQGTKCARRLTATQKSEESNGCFPALIDATDDTAKTLGKFGWFDANICER
ncbi:hypothetical protein Q0O86_13820, partial [Staphylococcus aureus]|nr:hypothetical protein [Staphylococcus aureus]